MRITVFGATGRTGRLLVAAALEEGHHVTAYARTPGKLGIAHPDLSVVEGRLDDEEALTRAVRGADAVIEGVGSESEGTRRIVRAMAATGTRRLVAISTCSVPDPADLPDLRVRALARFVRTVAPRPWSEVRAAAGVVRASGLDWTLVRVARLADGPPTGQVRAGHYGHGAVGMSIRRADLAAFLLGQVTDRTYVGAAPAVSG
ncbi:NAD(P)-dependent oxidoreductase [Streptomyces sp. NPDC049879]|uniref:NAD(P)-dependent oxidoreductase n=1 Tax=Streptomyces sp. NPDC049879 TaxID=3365598 RepID=UPI0037BC242D